MSDKDDIMPIEVPTDEELFSSEEVTEEKVEAQAEEAPEVKEEEQKENEVDLSDKDERPAPHQVPLNELLNEREKRQKLEAQMEAMQAQWEQQQQGEQQPQEWPDIFENPEAYQQMIGGLYQQQQMMQQQMQQQLNQQLAMARMEFLGELSLRNAKQRDPETYDAAWKELERRVQSGDGAWRHQVLSSEDPGQTLIDLYKQTNVAQTVGSDPEAYFQSRIEELRKDPQALAQLLGGAQAQAPNIDLPPSLTKAGGGGNSLPQLSGRDLWEDINS